MAVRLSINDQISSELELFRDAILSADVNKINFMLKNGIDPSIGDNFGINCFFCFSKLQKQSNLLLKGVILK
jgi:hypothetical protein